MIWRKVRDKDGKEREIHEISEDGILRNSKTKKLLKLAELKSGYKTHKYQGTHYNVHDLVVSTFLDIPKDALFAVHKTWNKTGRKYENQSNHHSNLQWVTQNDINPFSDNGTYYASKYGDFYNFDGNRYNLVLEQKTENGISHYDVRNNGKKKRYYVHKVVAKLFVENLENGKFVFHKDGDITNNNHDNLIWKNTLEGEHNGKMYYSIPKFSKYVLDEEDNLFSYQKGVFTPMKISERKGRYSEICLTNDLKEKKTCFMHVLVASVHLKQEEGKNMVDHIDGNRTNYRKKNLQRLNGSENTKKANRKPSKSRSINQYNLKGEFIRTYLNVKEASKETGISNRQIQKCAHKNIDKDDFPHKSGKYRWVYCENKYVIQEHENFKPVVIKEQYDIDEPKYLLSDKGILLSPEGYRKSIWSGPGAYKYCKIRGKNYPIHVLVALLFVEGRTEERNEVNHIDENVENFEASNLEWNTHAENVNHSIYRQYLPVEQIDMETGVVINIFPSKSAAAANFIKGERKDCSLISRATKNPMKTTAYGYYWRNVEK